MTDKGVTMSELERLEPIIRRITARRKLDHVMNNAPLNIDIQDLLEEIAGELCITNAGGCAVVENERPKDF